MRADEGYRLKDVLVDGTSVGSETTYRFDPVSKSHTISAQFIPLDTLPSPEDTGVSSYLDTKTHNAFLTGYPGNYFGRMTP